MATCSLNRHHAINHSFNESSKVHIFITWEWAQEGHHSTRPLQAGVPYVNLVLQKVLRPFWSQRDLSRFYSHPTKPDPNIPPSLPGEEILLRMRTFEIPCLVFKTAKKVRKCESFQNFAGRCLRIQLCHLMLRPKQTSQKRRKRN